MAQRNIIQRVMKKKLRIFIYIETALESMCEWLSKKKKKKNRRGEGKEKKKIREKEEEEKDRKLRT